MPEVYVQVHDLHYLPSNVLLVGKQKVKNCPELARAPFMHTMKALIRHLSNESDL